MRVRVMKREETSTYLLEVKWKVKWKVKREEREYRIIINMKVKI